MRARTAPASYLEGPPIEISGQRTLLGLHIVDPLVLQRDDVTRTAYTHGDLDSAHAGW